MKPCSRRVKKGSGPGCSVKALARDTAAIWRGTAQALSRAQSSSPVLTVQRVQPLELLAQARHLTA